MNLNYDIHTEAPVVIVALKGKITADPDFEELEKEVFTRIGQNYHHVIFDLKELTHTNSSGIAFFMKTLTKCRIMGGDLILLNLTGNVKKVFEISKLNEVYTIYNDRQEAMDHFKTLQ